MRKQSISFACGAAVLLAACSESVTPNAVETQAIALPSEGHVTSPRLSSDDQGNIVLSWLAPRSNGTALRFSSFSEYRWSPPATVVENVKMFVNWADLPSVVPLGRGRLAAHWLVKRPDNVYSYDVAFTQSSDDGMTWSDPISPHNDGTPTEHGFVSIFPSESEIGLIWLDGRKMVNEVTDDPAASGMTLRSGFVDAEQKLTSEQLIDDLACDCCQTDVAVAASGPIAVYRDRTPDEIRDISVARFIDGAWQPGRTIAKDNWEIAGCPVNGPSIVATESFVAVAWFTAAEEPTVQVSTSIDNGESFTSPHTVIAGDTLGRLGLAQLDNGDLAVSWMRSGANGHAEVLVRRAARNGSLGPIVTVTDTAALRAVPQMVRNDDGLILAWTEGKSGEHRIVSARIPLRAL